LQHRHGSEPDSGYSRLESQVAWYDRKSVAAQRAFKLCKVAEMSGAASVAVVANFNGFTASILGVVIVVLQGLQQVGRNSGAHSGAIAAPVDAVSFLT
jgi:Protein of unknown function (DUF4231)